MADTFTWFPTTGHSKAVEPRVSSAKFGDGYEQRVANGINNIADKWSLTFTASKDICDAIDLFLRTQGAASAFIWTNPDSETGKYICRSWNKSRDMGKVTVSATFERVFE